MEIYELLYGLNYTDEMHYIAVATNNDVYFRTVNEYLCYDNSITRYGELRGI